MKRHADIPGDGGSGVVAQVVEHRRAMADALAGVRHVVAIASGKGGVGKSTVTMALAQALLGEGQRVAVLDADLNGPCQAAMAGLEGRPWVPGDDGLEVPRRNDGLGVVSVGSLLPAGEALRFAATVSHGDEQVWRGTREITFLGQVLGGVRWGALDFLLVDLPPGAERTAQLAGLLGARAAFVLVTIPSAVARRVVARSVDALERSRSSVLGYVENMAGYACHGCGEVRPLFPEGEPLPLPCLGRIPFDPQLAALCDRGWPAGEGDGSPAVAAARGTARTLLTTLESSR